MHVLSLSTLLLKPQVSVTAAVSVIDGLALHGQQT